MSNGSMSPKQKGYIGLGAMVVLSAATIWGTEPLYKAIDGIGKEAIYTAGTYTGKAEGFGGEIIASVTVSDTTIQSIEIVGDGETAGIGTNAMEQLPSAILGKQSAEVDAVSGATITSDAIKTAVNQALALARGEEIAVETTAAATAEETKVEKPSVSYSFTPGTYSATAQGYGGGVTVELTVSETEILEIKVKDEDETPEIGGNALKKLPGKIMEAQSADVDAVSGATVTSDAIMKAAAEALAAAQGEGSVEQTEAAGKAAAWLPGTYTGEAQGYAGKIVVQVVVTEDGIQEVTVKGDDETPEIGGNALKKIPAKIVEAQSGDVDAVSGATVTSDAIKKAVTEALATAQGESSGADQTEAAAGAGKWLAGTYTGEAQGYGGKVIAQVVITEDGIQEVTVKGDDETPEIGGNVLKKLPGKIVEAQSADVDAISGATVTSDAVRKAVQNALEQAQG